MTLRKEVLLAIRVKDFIMLIQLSALTTISYVLIIVDREDMLMHVFEFVWFYASEREVWSN